MSEDFAGGRSDDASRMVAAIDIGSNSIKMTVGKAAPNGQVDEVFWASETVRLGSGLDATRRLADDRVEAALATLQRFAAEARSLGTERVIAVATEATRVAVNGAEFLERVRREAGIDVRLIGGDEEAELTFRGLAASTDVAGDVVVADIGGASTEVIVAAGGMVQGARSVPLGSGRLTDRLVVADPPTATELAACEDAAAAMLDGLAADLPIPVGGETGLVVVGGTGEYLARLVPDERQVSAAEVAGVLDLLQQRPAATLAADLRIAEARARVLPAGVAIVAALVDWVKPSRIEVARSGIRTGMLLAALAEDATMARDRGSSDDA